MKSLGWEGDGEEKKENSGLSTAHHEWGNKVPGWEKGLEGDVWGSKKKKKSLTGSLRRQTRFPPFPKN